MKIGMDISQTVYGTGVSRYTEELVKSLLKIDTRNDYIFFGASLRLYPKLLNLKKGLSDHKNVSFKLIPLPLFVFEFLFNKLHILPIEHLIGPVDLLHTSDWLEPPIRSAKKVTTIHDLTVYLFPNSISPRIVSNQKRKLDLVKKETDLIITVSQATKDDLIKFLQIPESKIKIIYSAASGEFKPQDEDKVNAVLAKHKIKKPYILSVATQEPRKNIQKLVDAHQRMKEKRDGINLVLVGKYGWGPANSANLDEDIISTGFVSQDDLLALYSGCRVFAYPSLYEGFGLPILEAMACGAPVVTSNNSSMAEIAKDAAILIDPRNENQLVKALEMVIDLKLEDYQKMVNASLNRARKYTWVKTARETLQIYKELLPKADKSLRSKDNEEKPDSKSSQIRQLK